VIGVIVTVIGKKTSADWHHSEMTIPQAVWGTRTNWQALLVDSDRNYQFRHTVINSNMELCSEQPGLEEEVIRWICLPMQTTDLIFLDPRPTIWWIKPSLVILPCVALERSFSSCWTYCQTIYTLDKVYKQRISFISTESGKWRCQPHTYMYWSAVSVLMYGDVTVDGKDKIDICVQFGTNSCTIRGWHL